MSGTQPVGVYALKVPPGDIMVPACPEFAAMLRVSMAAIDPSAEPEITDNDDKKPPRATLKIIRIPDDMMADGDSDDSEDDDDEYLDGLLDSEDSEDEEDEVNGGPSDPEKSKDIKPKKAGLSKNDVEMEDESESESSDEEAEAQALLKKLMKGKDKAVDGEDSDSDLDSEEDGLEMEEIVVCTLDPQSHYQQPLDIVVQEDEKIFFKVSGTHTIYLTGNYVIPVDDGQTSFYDGEEDEEDEYDLEPGEDELDEMDEDEESDDLDDLEDPRITEVDSEEEEAPKLVPVPVKPVKGKNKRPAEDSAEDEPSTLDELISKSIKTDETVAAPANGESRKLSKSEKKKLKKLKKNDGEAAAVSTTTATTTTTDSKAKTADVKPDAALTNGSEKKVQFAKNLEQGPTPSTTPPSKSSKTDKKPATEKVAAIRNVQGVTIDDRKTGSGPQAKKGNRVEMRYIGKLESGKVFDSNKSGKPFSFKLGEGEVISGWDIGLAGIAAGGERRLTIPADHGYGKSGTAGIPGNATLIFDVKCLSVKGK